MLIDSTVGTTREAGHREMAGLLVTRAVDWSMILMVIARPVGQIRCSPLQRPRSGLDTVKKSTSTIGEA